MDKPKQQDGLGPNGFNYLNRSSNKVSPRFKYLKYVPPPIYLERAEYDLVGDEEFCRKDSRILLLIVTQHGIFPGLNIYRSHKGKSTEAVNHDYSILQGLEVQPVGFIGRGYLSNRERKKNILYYLDEETLFQIRSGQIDVGLGLWG